MTTSEEGIGVGFELLVVLLTDESGADDLFARDVFVMPYIFLRRRGDDGAGEGFVLSHTLG